MSIVKRIILTFWTIILLLFRPSFVGEKYNQLVFVIFFLISLLVWIIDFKQYSFRIEKKLFNGFILVIFTASYFLIQGLILSIAKPTVLNSSILIMAVAICFLLVLRNENINFIFQKFINIHYLLSIFSCITFLFFLFRGLEISRLPQLANLNDFMARPRVDTRYFLDSHRLFFPFTVSWATVGFFGIPFPRLLGIYREAGMAQIFFITAYFMTYFLEVPNLRRKRKVILLGSILTFSTAGLLSFIVGLLVFNITNKNMLMRIKHIIRRNAIKFFVSLTILIIGIYIIFTIPDIGIKSKLSSESGKERFKSFATSWQVFKENPIWGIGYYGDFRKDKKGEVISNQSLGILGPLYQIGLVGIFLYFACWYYGVTRLGSRNTLVLYVPCFITLLLSQPSYNDVIVWFLILANTQYLGLEEQNENIYNHSML